MLLLTVLQDSQPDQLVVLACAALADLLQSQPGLACHGELLSMLPLLWDALQRPGIIGGVSACRPHALCEITSALLPAAVNDGDADGASAGALLPAVPHVLAQAQFVPCESAHLRSPSVDKSATGPGSDVADAADLVSRIAQPEAGRQVLQTLLYFVSCLVCANASCVSASQAAAAVDLGCEVLRQLLAAPPTAVFTWARVLGYGEDLWQVHAQHRCSCLIEKCKAIHA